MTEMTLGAGYARALLDFAVSKGADRATLLARSSIGPGDLASEDQRLAFAKYAALMRAAKELTRDPALALRFGEAVDMADISIVGLIGRASEGFLELWSQVNRFHRLGSDIDPSAANPFLISHEHRGVWLIDTRKVPRDFPEITETFFSRIICGPRRITNKLSAREVHFKHSAPAYRVEYDRVFQAPIVFESDKNAILFDEAVLACKNPLASRYAFGALSERAEALLEALEALDSTRAHVERMLMPVLHTGKIKMDQIADRMGVSRKTLFRRLKAESASFESVLDELRHKMALDYLTRGRLTVNETAYLVGFSDAAAFSRAFKRWTGMNPRAARSGGK